MKRWQRPKHRTSPSLLAVAAFFGVMQLYWAVEFHHQQTEATARESINKRCGTNFFYLPP